jgi:hypothetical protein
MAHPAPEVVAVTPLPESRPRWADYFLILCGSALSLFLAEMSGLKAIPAGASPGPLLQMVARLEPALLFLPQGIVLLWPLFYATQRLLGRQQALTAGEWLWGLAWLVMVLFTGWIAWRLFGATPDVHRHVITGYLVYAVAMAAIALILTFIGLVGRWKQPWTHHFSLVLMLWPALPLAILWLGKIKLDSSS